MPSFDLSSRLQALRDLLQKEQSSTQDDLRFAMERLGFAVNQSTVSRDLRRIGAVKIATSSGQTAYRLPGESAPLPSVKGIGDLVRSVRQNGSLVVILTDPGSASFVARHIDALRSDLVLGTIAGDDAIFVAPASAKRIEEMARMIEHSLGRTHV